MEQACGAPSNKALHSGLRISPGTPGDVLAFQFEPQLLVMLDFVAFAADHWLWFCGVFGFASEHT